MGGLVMKINKKRLVAAFMTAVLAGPVMATSVAMADNNASGSPEEQADITNWIANTPQQISNNMAMQHISMDNLNGTRYIIQWGDTLSGISAATGISVAKLCYDNNIQNANLIYAGDVLILNRDGNVPAGYTPDVNPYAVAQTKVTINNGPTNVHITVRPQTITKNDDHSTNIYSANNDNNNGSNNNNNSDNTTENESSSSTTKHKKSTKHNKVKLTADSIESALDGANSDDNVSFDTDSDADDSHSISSSVAAEVKKDLENGDADAAVEAIEDALPDSDKDVTVHISLNGKTLSLSYSQSDDDDDSSSDSNKDNKDNDSNDDDSDSEDSQSDSDSNSDSNNQATTDDQSTDSTDEDD
jgi:hypothetical protein